MFFKMAYRILIFIMYICTVIMFFMEMIDTNTLILSSFLVVLLTPISIEYNDFGQEEDDDNNDKGSF